MPQFWEATLGPGHMGPPNPTSSGALLPLPSAVHKPGPWPLPPVFRIWLREALSPPSREMLCALRVWGSGSAHLADLSACVPS